MSRKPSFWNERCRGEDGITLNELLIAMLISAIIVIPISGAIFTTLHTSGAAMSRTGQTVGANLLSTYFGPDVQNAVQVATGTAESGAVCGGTAHPVDLLLTTSPATSSISYYRGSTPATQMNLYRRTCAVIGGAGSASTPIVLMHSVSAAPIFSCVPTCADATWRSVTATVTQSNPPANPAPFSTTVQASRRVG